MNASPTGIRSSIIPWLKREFHPADFVRSLPVAALSYFLTLVFAVSFAALIFRGPMEASLSFGMGLTLYTAFAVGLVITLTSSIPAAMAIPIDRTAPILAVMASSLLALLPPDASYPLDVPRTASLIADQNCIIHELSHKALQELEQREAEAAMR